MENKFNFIKLALKELPYRNGGPRVYFISLYPSYLALLMMIIKNQRLFFFFNHLVTIGLSSGVIAIFFKILRNNYDEKIAFFASILLLFHPMYLSQTYAINMEIPILFFSMMAIYYFLDEKFLLAGTFSIIAFFIKPTSIVIALSLIFLYILFYFKPREEKHAKILCFYSLPIWTLFIYEFLNRSYFFAKSKYTIIGLFKGLRLFFALVAKGPDILLFVLPDILLFVLLVPMSAIILFKKYKNYLNRKKRKKIHNTFLTFRNYLKKDKLAVVSVVICTSLLFMFSNMKNLLPRYFLLGFPFFFILLYYGVLRNTRKHVSNFIYVVIFLFFLLNLKGDVYDNYRNMLSHVFKLKADKIVINKFQNDSINLATTLTNDGFNLEITLAFEKDIELDIEMAKIIEKNYSNKKIISSWPISHILSHPKYGYVKKNNLYVIDIKKTSLFAYEIFENVEIINKDEYIWVYTDNMFYYGSPAVYVPQRDILLEKIKKDNREIIIFKRN